MKNVFANAILIKSDSAILKNRKREVRLFSLDSNGEIEQNWTLKSKKWNFDFDLMKAKFNKVR